MKICWEILDILTLTQPKFAAKRCGWKEKQLISDWGIEIDGEWRYIETQWVYTEHCWYCGSDFLKPITMQNHYCDAECKHSHVVWKKELERLRKQRWRLMRTPKPKEKPTIGILGQPLGLSRGTTEEHEMRLKINRFTGKKRAVANVGTTGLAKYDTYSSKISWFIPKHRRNPKNPILLQVKCFNCKEWFTPKNKTVSKTVHWANTGIGYGKKNKVTFTVLYCNEECGKICQQTIRDVIRKHKFKIGEISFSKYHKIPNSILYYDWQLDLKKLNKKLQIELIKKQKEKKEKERQESLWKGKRKWKRNEARPNPYEIYRCNCCGRFLSKNKITCLNMDNISGKCEQCTNNTVWLWQEDNREQLRENTRRWGQENKEKRKKYKRANRIDKKRKRHPTSNRKNMALIYRYSRMLTKTTGILHEVDHIIPTAKNGKHHEDNLQVLTWKKNNKKADKLDTGITGPQLSEIKGYYSSII